MKNKLIGCLLLCVAFTAHAGFLTGAVVGYAVGSSSTDNHPPPSTLVISSDTHDVVTCKEVDNQKCLVQSDIRNPTKCEVRPWGFGKILICTPAQYAGLVGYTKLHKVATSFVNNEPWIVMEVSK